MQSLARWVRQTRLAWTLGTRVSPTTFSLVLVFYHRDPAYSLGLASIAAFARREIGDIRIHLVPIQQGAAVGEIVRIVRSRHPDLIGVSAMSPTWLPLDPYLLAVKGALPHTPILVGGYQGIVSPEETISHPAVDYLCVGDGERPAVGLIERLRGRASPDGPIPGLWEKRQEGHVLKSAPVLTGDLRRLPFPDYRIFARDGDLHYLSPRGIQSKRLVTAPVISGRGCPYRCSYCANTTLLDLFGKGGGFLRKYDPEVLVAEIAGLRDRYGAQYFQFWDEEFLYDFRYVRRFLDLYRRELGLPFSMFARNENMTDEVCRLAAAAGCHSIWFGVESGSETYRRRYLHRRMTNRDLREAARTARTNGIKLMALAMVGLPFESRDDARATLELMREIDPELAIFSQFLPLPGTPLHELCRQQGLLLKPSVEHQMWPLGRLNIKPHAGGMTEAEMSDAAAEIMRYLESNTRFEG